MPNLVCMCVCVCIALCFIEQLFMLYTLTNILPDLRILITNYLRRVGVRLSVWVWVRDNLPSHDLSQTRWLDSFTHACQRLTARSAANILAKSHNWRVRFINNSGGRMACVAGTTTHKPTHTLLSSTTKPIPCLCIVWWWWWRACKLFWMINIDFRCAVCVVS